MARIRLISRFKIASTVVTLIATAMTFSHAAAAESGKQIRFGVDPSYPPFESRAPDGSLKGFDIDLGNAICAKLHARCVWVQNDFDGMIPGLKARKFDAVLSAMSITTKRKQEIDFTDKLWQTPTQLVARAGSGLSPTAASLRGKRVGVQQGTMQEDFAKAHWAPDGVEVVPYRSEDDVVADLVAGRIDASLQDAVQASSGFLKQPQGAGFSFAGKSLPADATLGNGAGIGLRKDEPELRASLNQAIAELRQSGAYQAIAKKYFDFDVYGN
jgi:lysine/arginine/ornithine transport system substrate-binding protein